MEVQTTLMRSNNLANITTLFHYIDRRFHNRTIELKELIANVRSCIINYMHYKTFWPCAGDDPIVTIFDGMFENEYHVIKHELIAYLEQFIEELKYYCDVKRLLDIIVTEEGNMCILKTKPLNMRVTITYKGK